MEYQTFVFLGALLILLADKSNDPSTAASNGPPIIFQVWIPDNGARKTLWEDTARWRAYHSDASAALLETLHWIWRILKLSTETHTILGYYMVQTEIGLNLCG